MEETSLPPETALRAEALNAAIVFADEGGYADMMRRAREIYAFLVCRDIGSGNC
jgi:hypothetical protein